MYGNGLTVLVSKRFEGPESTPVESERWWLAMARHKKGHPVRGISSSTPIITIGAPMNRNSNDAASDTPTTMNTSAIATSHTFGCLVGALMRQTPPLATSP